MNNSFINLIKITLLFLTCHAYGYAEQNILDFVKDYQYQEIKEQPQASINDIAQQLLDKRLTPNEKYLALHNLAYAYYKANNKAQALDTISAAINLPSSLEGYHQAKSLLLRAKIYGILFRDTDTALLDLHQASDIITSSRHPKSIELHFNILTALAQAYNQKSNLPQAENYVDQAIVLATTLEDKNELIHALIISGRIYFQQDKLQKAYKQYMAALELTDDNTDIERVASIELRLAMIFNEQEIYSDSLKHAKKSVELYHQTSRYRMQVKSLRVLGSIYLNLGKDVDMALLHLLNALSIAKKTNDPYSIGHIQYLIGTAYFAATDYDNAIKYLKAAEVILESAQSNFYLGLSHISFSQIELAQNQPQLAIARIETMLNDSRFTPYPALINEARKHLVTILVSLQEFEQAFEHQQILLTAQQNKTEETNKSALASLNSVIEVKSLKEKVADLTAKEQKSDKTILKLQNWQYALASFLALCLSVLCCLVYKYRNIKKRFKQVNKHKDISWRYFSQLIKYNASEQLKAQNTNGGLLIAFPKLNELMKQAENRYFTGQNIQHWQQQLLTTFTPEESISHQQNLWMICASRPRHDLDLINQRQNPDDDAGFQLVWLPFSDLPQKISDNLLVFIEELVHKANAELPWQQGVSWGEIKLQTNALSMIFTSQAKEKLYWRIHDAHKRGLVSFSS
ncbi:tetratricopeptide repeat protein [Thalassomonas actiniarum]|uniref:MalT-like TPR region domain-containing protein n=1 Tax=Thalassomonas actiniarum TaxID=485447 RepID=A0AAE9YTW9_9GAMM|nr:hypothetical protein [Thalassomonas actiniarum]WDE01150.1 hypothetical protein SG35_011225 [Thalassomonas actiniarum]